MRKARWLAPWKDSTERPVIYHVERVSPLIVTFHSIMMRLDSSSVMAVPLQFEYPGAVYHSMARGDGGRVDRVSRSNIFVSGSGK